MEPEWVEEMQPIAPWKMDLSKGRLDGVVAKDWLPDAD
jgi:hypothetical protein